MRSIRLALLGVTLTGVAATAQASVSLTDAAHVLYNMSTDYNASDVAAVAGEAAGTTTWAAEIVGSVQATTLNGHTVADANMVANFTFAALTLENSITQVFPYSPGTPALLPAAGDANNTDPNCVMRSAVYPAFNVKSLNVSVVRKTYVPTDASFAREITLITNTGSSSSAFSAQYAGSYNQAYTTQGSVELQLYGLPSGGGAAGRLGGPGDLAGNARWLVAGNVADGNALVANTARAGLIWDGLAGDMAGSNFSLKVAGSGVQAVQLRYGYPLTLQPGETVAFLQYVVVAPTVAAAMSQSQGLAGLPSSAALECLTASELTQIANFCVTDSCQQAAHADGGTTGGTTGTGTTTGGTTAATPPAQVTTVVTKKGCSAGGVQTLALLLAAALATAAAGRYRR